MIGHIYIRAVQALTYCPSSDHPGHAVCLCPRLSPDAGSRVHSTCRVSPKLEKMGDWAMLSSRLVSLLVATYMACTASAFHLGSCCAVLCSALLRRLTHGLP